MNEELSIFITTANYRSRYSNAEEYKIYKHSIVLEYSKLVHKTGLLELREGYVEMLLTYV